MWEGKPIKFMRLLELIPREQRQQEENQKNKTKMQEKIDIFGSLKLSFSIPKDTTNKMKNLAPD